MAATYEIALAIDSRNSADGHFSPKNPFRIFACDRRSRIPPKCTIPRNPRHYLLLGAREQRRQSIQLSTLSKESIMKLAMSLILSLGLAGLACRQEVPTMSAPSENKSAGLPSLKTECKGGKITRQIWVSYESATGEGCKVHYAKPDENATEKVLWSASKTPISAKKKPRLLLKSKKLEFCVQYCCSLNLIGPA